MKRWIRDLLALQEQDLRIRNLEIKLKTIPCERARLIEEFEVVKKALAEAKTSCQQAEQLLKKLEADAAAADENRKKLLIQSASVKKNDEYQAMLQGIEKCKNLISDLETRQLEAMDTVEARRTALRTATKTYNSTGRAIQAELKEFEALKAEILEQITKTSELAKFLETKVEQSVLSTYKRLLSSGKGQPIAPVQAGGQCGNCILKLTPQTLNLASKGQEAYCDNCSHLVYDPNHREE